MSEIPTIPEYIDNCVRNCPRRIGRGDHYTSGYVMREVIKEAIESQCSGPIQIVGHMSGSIACGAIEPNYPPETREALTLLDIENRLHAVDQDGMRVRLDNQAYELEQMRAAEKYKDSGEE